MTGSVLWVAEYFDGNEEKENAGRSPKGHSVMISRLFWAGVNLMARFCVGLRGIWLLSMEDMGLTTFAHIRAIFRGVYSREF